MFSSFSWTNYFLFVGVSLVIYTLIIGFLYYRKEMNKLIFSKREAMNEMIERPVAAIGDPMRMVHELVSELGQLIRNASDSSLCNTQLKTFSSCVRLNLKAGSMNTLRTSWKYVGCKVSA